MHSSHLNEVTERNGDVGQKYADDEQLILAFKPSPTDNQINARAKMEKCIDEIRRFLLCNKLFNNTEKTELLLIGKQAHLEKLHSNTITVDKTTIKTTDMVKNLGVIFDNHMTMNKQVNSMCKKAYFNLSNISKIRRCLSLEDTKTVVNALVTPHLDYGNSLLYGISKKLENKLQVAQNSAVRLIHKVSKRDNISPYRKQLHWLPIPARIKYKIASMVWKVINDQSPNYLKNLIKIRKTSVNIRNNGKTILETPNVSDYNNQIERSFTKAAPRIWNNLPEELRCNNSFESFKKGLKTVLFTQAYS
jgi:hypothetical protein